MSIKLIKFLSIARCPPHLISSELIAIMKRDQVAQIDYFARFFRFLPFTMINSSDANQHAALTVANRIIS